MCVIHCVSLFILPDIMTGGFGSLGVRVRHIITYSLSPYEQRAFAGFLNKSPGNLVRRFFDNVFYVTPGFFVASLVYYYGDKDHKRRMRKDPNDYIDEE